MIVVPHYNVIGTTYFVHGFLFMVTCGSLINSMIFKNLKKISNAPSLILSSAVGGIFIGMLVLLRETFECWFYQGMIQMAICIVVSPILILITETTLSIVNDAHHSLYMLIEDKISKQTRTALINWIAIIIGVLFGVTSIGVNYMNDPTLINSGGNCQLDKVAMILLTILFVLSVVYMYIVYLAALITLKFSHAKIELNADTKLLLVCEGFSLVMAMITAVPYLYAGGEDDYLEHLGIHTEVFVMVFNTIPVICFMFPFSVMYWVRTGIYLIRRKRAAAILGCCCISVDIAEESKKNVRKMLDGDDEYTIDLDLNDSNSDYDSNDSEFSGSGSEDLSSKTIKMTNTTPKYDLKVSWMEKKPKQVIITEIRKICSLIDEDMIDILLAKITQDESPAAYKNCLLVKILMRSIDIVNEYYADGYKMPSEIIGTSSSDVAENSSKKIKTSELTRLFEIVDKAVKNGYIPKKPFLSETVMITSGSLNLDFVLWIMVTATSILLDEKKFVLGNHCLEYGIDRLARRQQRDVKRK